MKLFIVRLLMRLLDRSYAVDYTKIDKAAFEKWAYDSYDKTGWRSYFAYEDMKIMKEMTFGKPEREYMILVGRRLQLLYLFDEMRKAYELRKAEAEKKRDEDSK